MLIRRALRHLRDRVVRPRDHRVIFSRIHRENVWGDASRRRARDRRGRGRQRSSTTWSRPCASSRCGPARRRLRRLQLGRVRSPTPSTATSASTSCPALDRGRTAPGTSDRGASSWTGRDAPRAAGRRCRALPRLPRPLLVRGRGRRAGEHPPQRRTLPDRDHVRRSPEKRRGSHRLVADAQPRGRAVPLPTAAADHRRTLHRRRRALPRQAPGHLVGGVPAARELPIREATPRRRAAPRRPAHDPSRPRVTARRARR